MAEENDKLWKSYRMRCYQKKSRRNQGFLFVGNKLPETSMILVGMDHLMTL